MFHIIGGESPSRRVTYALKESDVHIEYTATRTSEIMHVYDSVTEKCVASFVNKLALPKMSVEDDGQNNLPMEVLKVTGSRADEFLHMMGVGQDFPVSPYVYGFEQVANRRLTQMKGMVYTIHGQSSVATLQRIGASVEDYLYELQELKAIAEAKDLDLSWADKSKKDYRLLVSNEDAEAFFEELEATEEMTGFDTETTGLLVGRTKRDVLVGLSISYKDHAGFYVPLQHKRFANIEMGMETFLARLKPFIQRGSKKAKELVTHNGGFDWKVMKMYGIDLNIVYDTFIRQGLKAISEAKNVMKLKEIVKRVLNYDVIELSDMYKPRSKADILGVKKSVAEFDLYVDEITRYKLARAESFDDLKYDFRFASAEFATLYGAADGDFPRLIHKIQDETWDKALDFIYRLEINLIPVLGEQEYYGVRAIESEFVRLYDETVAKLDTLEAQIYSLVGEEFNLNSPPQKARVVFEVLGCPVLPRFRNKSGSLKTDKDTMKTLADYKNEDGTPRFPAIALMSQHTKLSTLVKSFYSKLPKLLTDSFLFPNYRQLGTETGRISCNSPNLQQTEKTSRKYMIPDTDDHYFLICDYSQVEYRIMAGMSGEKKVVDFFANNPEADYHILAYANMMGKAYEDVTSAERKIGKVLNFGTTYGLEDENLALSLFGDNTEFHQRMASAKRAQYFGGVPVLRDYFESIRDEAQARGYVRTLFGRMRVIPEFNYEGKTPAYKIQAGRRKAGNMPVQGTAADLMKLAMIRVRAAIRKAGFMEDDIRLVMNIHDELVVQVHKSINMWYALSIIRKAMEIDMSKYGFPPLYVGANVGTSWSDGKADELEAPVLLMDEKIAEVEAKLARGEELPTYQNPKEIWGNEISYFALRQVEKEIRENNLKTIGECYKNIRIMKYARHFEVEREIDGKVKSVGFDNNIITLLLDGTHTAESIWANFEEISTTMEIVKYKPSNAGTVAVELPDDENSFLELLREHIRFDRQKRVLHLKLVDMDSKFLSILNEILVDSTALNNFRSDQVFCNINIEIGEDYNHYVKFRGLLSGFMPTIKDLMTVHLRGGDYSPFEHVATQVGDTLLKESV